MKSESSIDIDRPIGQVFELTNQDVPQWSNIVVEDVVTHDVNGGDVGTKFRVVTEDRGQRMEFKGVVTEYQPPHVNRCTMEGPMFVIDALYHFEDLRNGRTRVTMLSEVKGKGLFKIVFFFMNLFGNKSGCDALTRELISLKTFVESHSDSSLHAAEQHA